MVGRRTSPAFVGRRDALAAGAALLDGAQAGSASALLVAGEAGIGKTRVALELGAIAESRGWVVLRGACVRLGSGDVPFAPISDALRALVRVLDPAELARVLGDDRGALGRVEPLLLPPTSSRGRAVGGVVGTSETAWSSLLAALAATFRRLVARAPVLLAIEDLQWADPASLDVLSYLLRSLRDERVAYLLTFRTDDLHRHHPLRAWLGETERLAGVARIDLGPLDLEETGALVTAIRGTPARREDVATLHARSDGNPFFIEELATGAELPMGADGLPPRLRDVILARAAAVDADGRAILAACAVAGRGLEPRTLAAVCDLGPGDVDAAVADCIEHGQVVVVRTDRSDTVELRHALIREVVLADLLPGELRRLHGSLAGLLASTLDGSATVARSAIPPGGGGWAEVADHWDAAGDEPAVFASSLHAAAEATRACAFASALSRYRRAIAAWELVDDPSSIAGFDRLELLSRAAAVGWVAGTADAIELLREAIAEADRIGDAVRGALLRGQLADVLWATGRN